MPGAHDRNQRDRSKEPSQQILQLLRGVKEGGGLLRVMFLKAIFVAVQMQRKTHPPTCSVNSFLNAMFPTRGQPPGGGSVVGWRLPLRGHPIASPQAQPSNSTCKPQNKKC